MLSGTWANQPSSSLDSVAGAEEYQEPAWLAALVDIFRNSFLNAEQVMILRSDLQQYLYEGVTYSYDLGVLHHEADKADGMGAVISDNR